MWKLPDMVALAGAGAARAAEFNVKRVQIAVVAAAPAFPATLSFASAAGSAAGKGVDFVCKTSGQWRTLNQAASTFVAMLAGPGDVI